MTGLPWPPGPVKRPESQNGHRPPNAAGSIDLNTSIPFAPSASGTENGHGRHAAIPPTGPPPEPPMITNGRTAGQLDHVGSQLARRPEPAALTDTRLLAGVPEILTTIADQQQAKLSPAAKRL